MHCPHCKCQRFTIELNFSHTNDKVQELNCDDIVICDGCDRILALGDLEDDYYPDKE